MYITSFQNEYDPNFPEFGKQVTLLEPLHGYRAGTIIGREGYRFVIQVSSGATGYYYPDEIEFE